jgi:hypothetical protein
MTIISAGLEQPHAHLRFRFAEALQPPAPYGSLHPEDIMRRVAGGLQ